MDVDDRHAETIDEVAGEDLHVPGEHDEIDVSAELLHQLALGLGLLPSRPAGERTAAPAPRHRHGVLVVGDDGGDLHRELAAAPAPEQIQEAVVVAADHQGDPLEGISRPQPPPHAEALGDRRGEDLLELSWIAAADEAHAHEEATTRRIGRVLIERDDVRAARVEEPRDRGDDAGLVGARDQQARGWLAAVTCASLPYDRRSTGFRAPAHAGGHDGPFAGPRAGRAGYLFCQLAARLARKALMPSLPSADWKAVEKPAISAAMPASRSPWFETVLICLTAIGA